jgi:DNA invertase Pin-like site-specific DNA recombinase
VWRLDRWGRSLVDLVSTLQELTALKIGFLIATAVIIFGLRDFSKQVERLRTATVTLEAQPKPW